MSPHPPAPDSGASSPSRSPALLLAWLIAAISWFALIAQADITFGRMAAHGRGIVDGVERLNSYLTNLTALLSAVCFSALAIGGGSEPLSGSNYRGLGFFQQAQVIAAVTAYMVFVGIAYNLLLRHLFQPQGWHALVNECLHSVMPMLCLLYWLLFVPRFSITIKHSLLWLVYPLAYLSITLWRGSHSGFYPYPFINANQLGYAQVARNASGLVLSFLLLMSVMLAINRVGKRRRR